MNTRKLEIEFEIEKLEDRISDLENEISNFEIDPYDFENEYCEFIDDEGPVIVCGMEFNPSDILKEMDPTAYRCGLIDFADGMDVSNIPEFEQLKEDLEALQDELNNLEAELEDIENEEE